MKIKKSSLWLIFPIILILGLGVGGYLFYSALISTWKDPDTWTTTDVITLPDATDGLRLNYVVKDITESEKEFTFEADYCYLYNSSYSEDNLSVDLSCSMLPMYYNDRQAEVPKDWEEKADINIKLFESDNSNYNFLNRQDPNFDSLFALAEPLPVAVQISGKYTYPEENLTNMYLHWTAVKDSDVKESLKVTLNYSSFVDLSNPPQDYINEYAKTWKVDVAKEILEYSDTLKLNEKAGQEYLNMASALFIPERQRCSELVSCELEYDKNPAEKFMYYVYSIGTYNQDAKQIALDAMYKTMYPFNGQERGTGVGEVCETCTPDWNELSAYSFPICPIIDVFEDKDNDNTKLLTRYVEDFLYYNSTPPTTESEVLNMLKMPKQETYLEQAYWDREDIDAVNTGCYYILENGGVEAHPMLAQKIEDVYFEMLSLQVGVDINNSPESIKDAVYYGSAMSPYKSLFIMDEQVMRYREDRVQYSFEAADSYTEWRSLLHTLILLYLLQ